MDNSLSSFNPFRMRTPREELLTFLRAQPWAVQASISDGAKPQAAVIGVAVTDNFELVFDTLATSRKAINLRKNPHIALVLGWDNGETVQYEGIADEPTGDELEALKSVYWQRFPDGRERAQQSEIAYFRVSPTWLRYSDFRVQPPTIEEFHFDRKQAISAAQLMDDLRSLGVKKGSVLMVHSSMRKLGPVEGGAERVLEVLLDAIGPEGTLVMVLSAPGDEPFDAKTTPVDTEDMGILAEIFRQHPRTLVNDHAADRFAANGPLAEHLLSVTRLHHYHGPESVLERLVQADGAVLRLGANRDTVTLTHYAEYLAQIPEKRQVKLRYVRADIGEQWIESLDDTYGIAEWAHGDYFPQILEDFLGTGEARVGQVGHCTAELLPARKFVDFAVKWIETNLVGEHRTDWPAR